MIHRYFCLPFRGSRRRERLPCLHRENTSLGEATALGFESLQPGIRALAFVATIAFCIVRILDATGQADLGLIA